MKVGNFESAQRRRLADRLRLARIVDELADDESPLSAALDSLQNDDWESIRPLSDDEFLLLTLGGRVVARY